MSGEKRKGWDWPRRPEPALAFPLILNLLKEGKERKANRTGLNPPSFPLILNLLKDGKRRKVGGTGLNPPLPFRSS